MSQNPIDFLSEDDFFRWATKLVGTLDELFVVSHTPIMFFDDEQVGPAKDYLKALYGRFVSGELRTTYFMSEGVMRTHYPRFDLTVPGSFQQMDQWQRTWELRQNVSVKVVRLGHFPSVSLFLGNEKGTVLTTTVKVRFEAESLAHPPLWLRVGGAIPGVDRLLRDLDKNSEPFGNFLSRLKTEKMKDLENMPG